MRMLFRTVLTALSFVLVLGLIGCASQRAYMAFVYRNGGTLDITSMTASFPDGIVAKDLVTRPGSESLARRFVAPPPWFDISWTTTDGVRREKRVVLEGRYTNLKKLDGILIQISDDRIEVFETNIGHSVWSGGRQIY